MGNAGYDTILLLVEGSDEGMEAARDCVALAEDQGADIVAAAVVDTNMLRQLLTYRIFVKEEMEEYEEDLRRSAEKHLNYVSSLAEDAGVECRTELLSGATHSSVLARQEEEGADLLVMGAFRASTAQRDVKAREKQLILDEIACPVLLVR